MNVRPDSNAGFYRAKIALTALLLIPALIALAMFLLMPLNPGNPNHDGIRLPLVLSSLLLCVGIFTAFWARPALLKFTGAMLTGFLGYYVLSFESVTRGAENMSHALWQFMAEVLVVAALIVAVAAIVAWVGRGFAKGTKP